MKPGRFLTRHEALGSILVSGTGALLAPLVTFFCLPFILRTYGPAEYGLWLLVMSLALIPGNISTLRYDLAIVLVEGEKDAGRLFVLCCLLAAGFSVWGLVLVGLSPFWKDLFPALQGAEALLWLVPALIFLVGLFWTGTSTCTRRKAFGVRSASLVLLAAGTNGFQLLAPKIGIEGGLALVLGSLAGYSLSVFLLAVGVFYGVAGDFIRGMKIVSYRDLMVRYQYFPRFSVPYNFMGTLRTEGVKMLFGGYGSSALVGDFSIAQRLTNFPVTLFGGGIRPVLFQKASRTENLASLLPLVKVLLMGLSLLVAPAVVAFQWHAPAIIGLLGGSKWLGAVPYARILVVPAAFLLHVSWLDRIFDVQSRQKLALQLQAGFSFLSLLVLGIGLLFFHDPRGAVLGQAMVLVLYYLVLLLTVFQVAGFGLRPLGLLIAFPFSLAGGTWLVRLILEQILPLPWATVGALLVLWSSGGLFLWKRLPWAAAFRSEVEGEGDAA